MNRNQPIRVLFISDDVRHRQRIVESMADWGCVIVLQPKVPAMDPGRLGTFDLVLLDLGMPDSPTHRHIPVLKTRYPESRIITITWHNNRPLEVAVRKHGVAYHLVASEKMKDLKAIVDHLARPAGNHRPRQNAA